MHPRPCPFCGSTNLIRSARQSGIGYEMHIRCKDCGATGPHVYTDQRDRKEVLRNANIQLLGIKYWNRRAAK